MFNETQIMNQIDEEKGCSGDLESQPFKKKHSLEVYPPKVQNVFSL